MLLYTNGTIIIEQDNKRKDLDKNVKKLTKWLLEEKGIECEFKLSEEHNNLAYLIPEGITYDMIKDCFGSYIDLKAINEEKFVLPYTKMVDTKYTFKQEELQEIALKNMQMQDEINKINMEKSIANKEFTKRIEVCEKEMEETKTKFQDGFEMRDFECQVHVDFITKKKIFIDLKDETVRKVSDLEDHDYKLKQLHIFNRTTIIPEVSEVSEEEGVAEKPDDTSISEDDVI